jgi:cysteine desulfurase / selenocysteine lyase
MTDEGRLDLSQLDELVNERTKLVSIVHYSNILGTINPVELIAARAHAVGALVLVDGSQSVPHLPVDVASLGVDLLAFTGHKMLGPTGIGALWGRAELLDAIPPFLGGGSMIETVAMTGSTFMPPPARFEAGTPPIAQAIGLGEAVDYLTAVGMDNVRAHEKALTAHALDALQSVPGLRIVGPTTIEDRGATISFTLDGVHPHDVGQILDDEGVEVRVGHHCARPTCVRFGVPATTRASFYLYTTTEEVDALVRALDTVRKVFA